MMYDNWRKELDRFLDKQEFQKLIPPVVKRCPKCNGLTLVFDIESGKIYCTKCGFSEYFKKL